MWIQCRACHQPRYLFAWRNSFGKLHRCIKCSYLLTPMRAIVLIETREERASRPRKLQPKLSRNGEKTKGAGRGVV